MDSMESTKVAMTSMMERGCGIGNVHIQMAHTHSFNKKVISKLKSPVKTHFSYPFLVVIVRRLENLLRTATTCLRQTAYIDDVSAWSCGKLCSQ